MPSAYELLLLPAVGTALLVTFAARGAMLKGFQAAPLGLFAMGVCFLATGAAAALFASPQSFAETWGPDTVWVPLVGGLAGAVGVCFSYTALRQRATGPVTTISQMSVLWPVGLSLLAGWDARPGLVRLLGAVLTLSGIAVINMGKSPRPEGERFHWIGLAVGAMVCFGVSQSAQKYITVLHPQPSSEPRYVFMATYYFACALALLAYTFLVGKRLQPRAWPYAACLSAGSIIQFACMLVLLQHLSTTLVYITFTGGGIVLITLVSTLLLGERYRPAVWAGCLLGIAGIVLMRV
jgi:drug/metabolite transporter (DMT)-like permease